MRKSKGGQGAERTRDNLGHPEEIDGCRHAIPSRIVISFLKENVYVCASWYIIAARNRPPHEGQKRDAHLCLCQWQNPISE